MTADPIRIGSWNILGRRSHASGDEAPPGAVAETVHGRGFDLLCLQEAHFYNGEPDPVLVAELEEAGLAHLAGAPVSSSHLDPAASLGNLVASRHPLRFLGLRLLHNPRVRATVKGAEWVLHDKGIVTCEVLGPWDRPLRVHAVHLFPFHEFGIGDDDPLVDGMWREFWHEVDGGDDDRVVVAGDFNQGNRERAAKDHSARTWQFCVGADRPTAPNGLSLDDIALSDRFAAVAVDVSRTFSDHFLVDAEVRSRPVPG